MKKREGMLMHDFIVVLLKRTSGEGSVLPQLLIELFHKQGARPDVPIRVELCQTLHITISHGTRGQFVRC